MAKNDETPDLITRAEAMEMAKAAAQEAVASAISALNQTPANDPQGLINGLAMAIAQLGQQGVGKETVVDPSVIASRRAARERMTRLIMEARDAGLRPEYELGGTQYLNHQMVPAVWIDKSTHMVHPTRIKWIDVPNEMMVPADDLAREIFAAFCDSIGKAPGTRAHMMPIGARGDMVTPNGNYLEVVSGIPKDYMGERLRSDDGAVPDIAPNGLEVLGGAPGGMRGRETAVNVLGTLARPARQMVA